MKKKLTSTCTVDRCIRKFELKSRINSIQINKVIDEGTSWQDTMVSRPKTKVLFVDM